MSVIGEAALSSLLEAAFSSLFKVLFGTLTSSDLMKIFQQEQVHVDLNKWNKTLLKITAVLEDAEEKREISRSVRSGWRIWKAWLMMRTTYWMSMQLKFCDVS